MERAHPRSCGENRIFLSHTATAVGSSPLMRGKLESNLTAAERRGLIPAHAGKTTTTTPTSPASRAHPRSCGENGGCDSGGRRHGGSSPLMRGKQVGAGGGDRSTGLIPAHAGKTVRRARRIGVWGAHPRSCGENSLAAWRRSILNGSSPLMRGKR